jgi:acyl-CoA synthetase (AMP-forming)/AMP-acid ligase II
MLRDAARRWPGNEAVSIAGKRATYAGLLASATRYALGLRALGVRRDDHVGILLPNSLECVIAYFGISMAGATAVPYNTRFKPDELAYLLGDARPRVTITTDAISDYTDLPGLVEDASQIQQELYPADEYRPGTIVSLGAARRGALTEERFLEPSVGVSLYAALALADLPHAQYAAVVYTSGTTSRPRGALLTPDVFEHWRRVGALWEITDHDRFWDPCPLFHIAGIGPLIWTITHGATFVSDTYFDAGNALRTITEEKATLLYPTYPPIMRGMMTHETFSSTDLSSVRAFLNVAPPEDLRAMQAAIPGAVEISLYGSTEGGPVSMHSVSDPIDFRVGTNGRAVEGVQLRVYDSEKGATAPLNEPGEIQYRGPNTFSGYLNDPVKTAASLDSEGWVHTGDLGRIDAEGTLYYLGRVNDMIKVGGENVAPAEVEEVLGTHPAVKLSQVVGIPHERLVEAVAAFVELVPGATATEEELIQYSRERMARYKVPVVVRIVEEWPMSATKIQRAKLRDLLMDEDK